MTSIVTAEDVFALVSRLSATENIRLITMLASERETRQPTSVGGAAQDLGPAPSADDIDDARREMLGGMDIDRARRGYEEQHAMPDSSGTWNMETSTEVDDPLKGYDKKPVISRGGPNATYVGRVIIEMWDGVGRDDGDRIAMVVGAMDGHHGEFLERIAAALTLRLQRGNPFKDRPAAQ